MEVSNRHIIISVTLPYMCAQASVLGGEKPSTLHAFMHASSSFDNLIQLRYTKICK